MQAHTRRTEITSNPAASDPPAHFSIFRVQGGEEVDYFLACLIQGKVSRSYSEAVERGRNTWRADGGDSRRSANLEVRTNVAPTSARWLKPTRSLHQSNSGVQQNLEPVYGQSSTPGGASAWSPHPKESSSPARAPEPVSGAARNRETKKEKRHQ